MTAAAVLANPRASQVRRRPDLVSSLREVLGPDVAVLVPQGLDALDRTARELREAAPDVVGVLGGDGTLSQSLTALARAWGDEELPPVAPLGGGTMNTVARSLGARGRPTHLAGHLRAHLEGRRALHPVERSMLEVDGERLGFLFGNGLFARYIAAYEEGEPGPRQAAWVLARATASAMVGGRFAQELTAPTRARLEVDGEVLGSGPWLVAAAGTVEAVGLGFRPFVGALREPGHLHCLGIGCSPFELALQLHRPLRGRPFHHDAIVEATGRELVIHGPPDQRYNLDGDLSPTGPVTTVRVARTVRFLVPSPTRTPQLAPPRASGS